MHIYTYVYIYILLYYIYIYIYIYVCVYVIENCQFLMSCGSLLGEKHIKDTNIFRVFRSFLLN